jgi:hypothetical protein
MHRDYAKLPLPDEAIARERYLRQGVAALDLATVKDFICFLWAFSILRWSIRAKKLKSLEIQRSTSQGRVGSFRRDGGCKEDLRRKQT